MRKELGNKGEDWASRYLEENGYMILERNYRSRSGEIDIICSQGGSIIFVEVKTRRNISFGYPEEAITKTKQQHIRKAALAYMNACNRPYNEIRFDVIGILLKDGKPQINHLPAAF